MLIFLAVNFLLQTCLAFIFTSEDIVAYTRNGEVRGQSKISQEGRPYHAFTAIPYAKAPIAELRFRDPQKPDIWNSTWDATQEPPTCIQRNYLFTSNPPIEGSEDCLYLNVFVPQGKFEHIPNVRAQPLPVMVFIHWGAFIAGKSSTGYLGPEYFMDKNVILVTFNYRLGPFGFLSTLDDEAPGNYGFKDQVLALKWVQDNIGYFGGDKRNVTIFGQSAGAGSVHYHLLSPASKGLFQRAISQSGSALAAWAAPLNPVQKQLTALQAKFVGCGNFTDSKDLVTCLRAIPAEVLMKTQDLFKMFNGNPLGVFGAVIEAESKRNSNPFITKPPLEYILNGEFENVPWMTGVVKNEGVLRAASLIRSKKVREELNHNFEKLLTDVLLVFSLSTTDPQDLYENVTQFYMGGKEYIDVDDPKTIQGMVDVYSDRAFMYPLYQTLQHHLFKGHSSIYLYNFEYEGEHTYGDLFAGTDENIDFHWGSCHCDDLFYLFNSPDLFPEPKQYNDTFLTKIMVTLWTNFAKYGNPNPKNNPVHTGIDWRPLRLNLSEPRNVNNQMELLNITGTYTIGPTLEISNGFYKERMKFWTDSNIFENAIELK